MNVNFKLKQAMPQFLPYPLYILKTDLNLTAREVYALLFHRTTLSQQNGWSDEDENVFVIYPITEIAKDLGCSETTVKRALHSLGQADLIERRRCTFNGANRIFLKLPKDQM